MRVNLHLAENSNVIMGWVDYPIDENGIILEIEDPNVIRLGIDKYIDGEYVRDDEAFRKLVENEYRIARIRDLKEALANSDYKLLKYLEGWMTEEEYAETKAQRQAWREEINELEAALLG